VAVSYRQSGPAETLAIRAHVPYAEVFDWLDPAFTELRAAVLETGVRRAGADAALYSSELLEDEFGEVVAVVPVGSPPRAVGRSEPLTLPHVEYAVAVHSGSLENIDSTYAALGAVVAERAIGVHGPIREDYVVSSFDTADAERYRTDICWPVFQTTSVA
jgi:effector-binding domain-containing protein